MYNDCVVVIPLSECFFFFFVKIINGHTTVQFVFVKSFMRRNGHTTVQFVFVKSFMRRTTG